MHKQVMTIPCKKGSVEFQGFSSVHSQYQIILFPTPFLSFYAYSELLLSLQNPLAVQVNTQELRCQYASSNFVSNEAFYPPVGELLVAVIYSLEINIFSKLRMHSDIKIMVLKTHQSRQLCRLDRHLQIKTNLKVRLNYTRLD